MHVCLLIFVLTLSAQDENVNANQLFNIDFVKNDELHEFTSLLQGAASRPQRRGYYFSKIARKARMNSNESKSATLHSSKTSGHKQDVKPNRNDKLRLARNALFYFGRGARSSKATRSKRGAMRRAQAHKDDDVVYQGPDIDLGRGECLTTGGRIPARERRFVTKGSPIECGKHCAFSHNCAGYSVSFMGVCTLYNEVPLYPKRPTKSEARCYIRNVVHSNAWPSLPLIARNYLGCVADVVHQKSAVAGITRLTVDKSKNTHSTASCAAHCMDRLVFVLSQEGRRCACADDIDAKQTMKYLLDDRMCEPVCDGETGLTPKRYCGDTDSSAVYSRRMPDEGDECPDAPGRHNYESRYMFLKGDTTDLTANYESEVGSCNECAGLCTDDCHGFECTIKSGNVNHKYADVRICRLFDMPIPMAAEVKINDTRQQELPRLGHVCARKTCDVPSSCKGKGYRLRSGFNYLRRSVDRSANATCDTCADVCDSSADCTAYQCSDSLKKCYTYRDSATTRAPDSTFVVSDIALCLRLPNETCIITNGTLGTTKDCLCGPDTICFPGERCDLMETPFAKCRPPRPEPPTTCNQTSACPASTDRNLPAEKCTVANTCRECDFPPGCTDVVSRVCGSDNATYDNRCEAECSGTLVNHTGGCGTELPANCTEWNLDAFVVCGSDQRTYLDTCWASEAGVSVTSPVGVPCLPTCTFSVRKDCMCGAEPHFTRCPDADSCVNQTCVSDCTVLVPQRECGCTNDLEYEMCSNETSCAALVHSSPRHDLLCVPTCGQAPENRTSNCACVKNWSLGNDDSARTLSNGGSITPVNLCVGNATHCNVDTGECDRPPLCKKGGDQFCLCSNDPDNAHERSLCETVDKYCPDAFGRQNDTCVPLCQFFGDADCLCGSYTLCNHGLYCSGRGGDSTVNSMCIPYCTAGDSNCICADTHCTDTVDANNAVTEKKYCTGASTEHCSGPRGHCPVAPPYCVPLCTTMWQTDCLCATDPHIGDYCHNHHRCNLTAATVQCVKGTCHAECEDTSGSFTVTNVPGCPCAEETYCATGSYCLQSETYPTCLDSSLRRCKETSGLHSGTQTRVVTLASGQPLLKCKCGEAVSGPVCEADEYCWEDANECISGTSKSCNVSTPCVDEACMCGSTICRSNDICMKGECRVVLEKCPRGGIASTACECYGAQKRSTKAQRVICAKGTRCEVADTGKPVCTTSVKAQSEKCTVFCEPAKSDCVCGRNLNATCGHNMYCNGHGSLTNTTCVPFCFEAPDWRSSHCVCRKEGDVNTLDVCHTGVEEQCDASYGRCGPARLCAKAGDQFCVCGSDAQHYPETSFCRVPNLHCPNPFGTPNNTCVPICASVGDTDCLCGKYALCNNGTYCSGVGGGPDVDSACVPRCTEGETGCICADTFCSQLTHSNGTLGKERFCSSALTNAHGSPSSCLSLCEKEKETNCLCNRDQNTVCRDDTYCSVHNAASRTCVPVCFEPPEMRSSDCMCEREDDANTFEICVGSNEHCASSTGTCGPAELCKKAGDKFCVCGQEAINFAQGSYCRSSKMHCPYPYGALNNTCVPMCASIGDTDCLCGNYTLCNHGTYCSRFGGGPEENSVCIPFCGKGDTNCICADIHCTPLLHGNGTVKRERFCSDVTTHLGGPLPLCAPVCEKDWETDCLCTDNPTRGTLCVGGHTRCSRLSNAPCMFKCEPECENMSGSVAATKPCPCATETVCHAGEYCFSSNSASGCYAKPLAQCSFLAEGLTGALAVILEPFGLRSKSTLPPCKCGHAEVPAICEQGEYCWEAANACISGKIKACGKGRPCLDEACLCGSTPCGAGDVCIHGECNIIVEECPERRVSLRQCMCRGTRTPVKRTMCDAGTMCQVNEHHDGVCIAPQPPPTPEEDTCLPDCLQAPLNFTTNCTCHGDARQEHCTNGDICGRDGKCYAPCKESGSKDCACGTNLCIDNDMRCPFPFGNPNDTCFPLCSAGESDCLCGHYTLCNDHNVNGSLCSGAGGNSGATADSTCLPYCFDAIHNRATNCGCRNEDTSQVELCVGLERACDKVTRACKVVRQCTKAGDQFCVCGQADCLTSDLYCPFPKGSPNDTCVPLCTHRGDTDCLCGNYTLCNDSHDGKGPLVCSGAGGNASVTSSCLPSCELGGTGCICGANAFCPNNGPNDDSTSYCVAPYDRENSWCAPLCKAGQSDCLCGNYTWCSSNTASVATTVCSGTGGGSTMNSKCVLHCERGGNNCFCGNSFCPETQAGARFCSERSPTPVQRSPSQRVSSPQCLPLCMSDARTNCLCTHDPHFGDACAGEQVCSMACPGSCTNGTASAISACPTRDLKSQSCACGRETCTALEECVFAERCVPKYWVDQCETDGCVKKLCECGTATTDDHDGDQSRLCLPGDMCQDGVCTTTTPRCYEGEGECICADNEYCGVDMICIGDKDNRKCATAPLCN